MLEDLPSTCEAVGFIPKMANNKDKLHPVPQKKRAWQASWHSLSTRAHSWVSVMTWAGCIKILVQNESTVLSIQRGDRK